MPLTTTSKNDPHLERKQSFRHLPTDYQKDEQLIRATLLKAVSHHIPTGRCTLHTQQVPVEILAMMEERDDLRKQDPASPRLSTSDHKRRQWREFVESIDHRTDNTKLWRTIKRIDGKLTSSRRARHVSKDVKRLFLEEAESFTSDQVTSAIRRAYGPDSLSIFHLKNLGPLANRTPHNTIQ